MDSQEDAEEVLRSTKSNSNFQRLTRLLMRGGAVLLREIFDSIHSPANLPTTLSDPSVERKLRTARLTRPDWNCLYPSPGVYGKSSDFDISLTFRLLRTICKLKPPPTGWDSLPNDSEHSLEADMVRIKYYRNEVYGHSRNLELSDDQFLDLWGKISKALLRIGAKLEDIELGSLSITVRCSSLQILEGLWKDYISSHLTQVVQETLVTDDVLEILGLDELKLKVFISEEEYEKGKKVFADSSGEYGDFLYFLTTRFLSLKLS